MKAVVFVFRPVIKEFLNVWTFNLCSATTWTYPFAKHRLTKSSWNVVYLWINQIWQSRLTLQIHFQSQMIDIFHRKQATKFLLHNWLLEVILFLGVIWNPSNFSRTLFHSYSPSQWEHSSECTSNKDHPAEIVYQLF